LRSPVVEQEPQRDPVAEVGVLGQDAPAHAMAVEAAEQPAATVELLGYL
jgi:hypothetical protein